MKTSFEAPHCAELRLHAQGDAPQDASAHSNDIVSGPQGIQSLLDLEESLRVELEELRSQHALLTQNRVNLRREIAEIKERMVLRYQQEAV